MNKDILENLEKQHRRMSEFKKLNMNELGKQYFQDKSEVELFNIIGEYAKTKDYYPSYFKARSIKHDEHSINLTDIHYIHIYNETGMKISIFYDKEGSILTRTSDIYEMYFKGDVCRYHNDAEGVLELYNQVLIYL